MKNRAELELELVQQAESQIKEMLDDLEQQDRVNLSQLEERLQTLGRHLLASTMQTVVNSYAKMIPPAQVVTQHGALEVRRDYYTCRDCEQGYFPPR